MVFQCPCSARDDCGTEQLAGWFIWNGWFDCVRSLPHTTTVHCSKVDHDQSETVDTENKSSQRETIVDFKKKREVDIPMFAGSRHIIEGICWLRGKTFAEWHKEGEVASSQIPLRCISFFESSFLFFDDLLAYCAPTSVKMLPLRLINMIPWRFIPMRRSLLRNFDRVFVDWIHLFCSITQLVQDKTMRKQWNHLFLIRVVFVVLSQVCTRINWCTFTDHTVGSRRGDEVKQLIEDYQKFCSHEYPSFVWYECLWQ